MICDPNLSNNGINHMKKRADKINSELEIFSKDNVGTTIYFIGKTT
jgi:signal transduction histidine kinase